MVVAKSPAWVFTPARPDALGTPDPELALAEEEALALEPMMPPTTAPTTIIRKMGTPNLS